MQERLDEAAEQITGGRDEADVPGLGGVILDLDRSAIDIYWSGRPPQRIDNLVRHPPPDVTIRLHSAPYDTATLMKAVNRLAAAYENDMHTIDPSPKGTGLEIGQTRDQASSGPSLEQMSRAAGVPVTTRIGEVPTEADK